MYSNILSKQEIRKLIKKKINNLSISQKKLASSLVFNKIITLLNTNTFVNLKYFGCFWPQKHEINIIPIIDYLLNHNKFCYLPVINSQEKILNFFEYTKKTQLIPNKFGIFEPKNHLNKTQIPLENLEIIFIPNITFNLQGDRIGSGSGYYDRTLNKLSKEQLTKITLIGLGFLEQQLDQYALNFIPDPWDIKLNYIITDV